MAGMLHNLESKPVPPQHAVSRLPFLILRAHLLCGEEIEGERGWLPPAKRWLGVPASAH